LEIKLKRLFNITVFASFLWNLYLVIGVMLGADYALERAAGGQFDSFPTYIRFLYLLNTAVILWQLIVYLQIVKKSVIKPAWTLKVFVIMGVLGIVANAASRSQQERWNVIPAAIITFTFYIENRRRKQGN
jgi:hypothetical protein